MHQYDSFVWKVQEAKVRCIPVKLKSELANQQQYPFPLDKKTGEKLNKKDIQALQKMEKKQKLRNQIGLQSSKKTSEKINNKNPETS